MLYLAVLLLSAPTANINHHNTGFPFHIFRLLGFHRPLRNSSSFATFLYLYVLGHHWIPFPPQRPNKCWTPIGSENIVVFLNSFGRGACPRRQNSLVFDSGKCASFNERRLSKLL